MKLDDGEHSLAEVRVHLTRDEAEQAVATLSDLLDDLARVGIPTSHSYLSFGGNRELGVFVYSDAATLEADTGRL